MFGLSRAEIELIDEFFTQRITNQEASKEYKKGYLEALSDFKGLCLERIKENMRILYLDEEKEDESRNM